VRSCFNSPAPLGRTPEEEEHNLKKTIEAKRKHVKKAATVKSPDGLLEWEADLPEAFARSQEQLTRSLYLDGTRKLGPSMMPRDKLKPTEQPRDVRQRALIASISRLCDHAGKIGWEYGPNPDEVAGVLREALALAMTLAELDTLQFHAAALTSARERAARRARRARRPAKRAKSA
jgi:hypothetical protein